MIYIVQALLAVLCMAAVPIVISSITTDVYSIGVVRLAVASLGVCGWYLWRRGWPKLSRANWLWLMLIGLVFAIHWLSYFISVRYSTASIAAIAISTYGIHLSLLGAWLLKKRLKAYDLLAIVVAIIGVILIERLNDFSHEQLLGFAIGVVSAVLYALLPILHQKNTHLSNSLRTSGQFFFALLLFIVMAIPNAQPIPAEDWPGLLLISVVSTLIGHSLWVSSSSALPPVATSLIYYLYVPAAMLGSFLFNKEQISGSMIIGASLIIGANSFSLLMKWRDKRKLVVN